MGKAARITELEDMISLLEAEVKHLQKLEGFIDKMCKLPEDAVLLYTFSGMRIQCEIGEIARAYKSSFQ